MARSLSTVCALRGDGSVWCWGDNAVGALGDGSFDARDTPAPVAGVHDATQLVMGDRFSCALRRNGTIVCWGLNSSGQLGDGAVLLRPMPVVVNAR